MCSAIVLEMCNRIPVVSLVRRSVAQGANAQSIVGSRGSGAMGGALTPEHEFIPWLLVALYDLSVAIRCVDRLPSTAPISWRRRLDGEQLLIHCPLQALPSSDVLRDRALQLRHLPLSLDQLRLDVRTVEPCDHQRGEQDAERELAPGGGGEELEEALRRVERRVLVDEAVVVVVDLREERHAPAGHREGREGTRSAGGEGGWEPAEAAQQQRSVHHGVGEWGCCKGGEGVGG
mmetsp:Transcript_27517/g.66615  ORF Transcript_27517/g.66615 Transcript_27517/m.66615 type:complete len:233 (+) Transcript_27517:33-731(+)